MEVKRMKELNLPNDCIHYKDGECKTKYYVDSRCPYCLLNINGGGETA